MRLTPDKIELAQQIADVLEERINALPEVFYHSTHTKEDCFKHLITPLLGEKQIDTLLESLPSHIAMSLREKHSRLMSCFNPAGELLDKNRSLTTFIRYANDLVKELRHIAQGSTQNTTSAEQKDKSGSTPIAKRFTFRQGQVLFDDRDLNVGTGVALDIIETLVENFGYVVLHKKLDKNSLEKEASEKIRTAITRLRETIKSAKIPVVIQKRRGEGYLMLPATK